MSEILGENIEFKDSAVGQIPKDWDVVRLSDEVYLLHGYAFKGEYFSNTPPGEILLVPGNFHRDGGLYFDEKNTKYYQGVIPKETVLGNEDLLIVMTDLSPRTLILGKVVQLRLPFKVLHNQRIGKIIPKFPESWDKRFLMLVINSDKVRKNIISTASGTTVKHTSVDRITINIIPKPELQEQQKIAEILDTVEKAIALTQTHINKLKLAKAGLLHDLLTKGIDEHGELRNPKRNPEQFKDSPLGKIPKDWETPTIDEIKVNDAPICYGIVQPGFYDESGIKVLAIYNMGGDYINNIHKTSQSIENRYIRSRVQPNDILISVKGTIGRVDIVPEHFFGNISRDIARIRLKSCALPKYVCQTFTSQIFQLQIVKTSVGTTRAEISIWVLKQLIIPLPPLEEQKRIINYLETHNFYIISKQTRLEKLKQLKLGLMSDLLTGKVRVKI